MAIDSDLVCTITLTSGSKDFTIAGASLVTADIQPGDEINLPLKGLTLTIGEVLTATTGKLTDNCPAAAAGAAQAARLRYQSDLSRAAAKFENLATLLGNGNVDALAGLTLANNKGIHATGLNTLGTHDLTPFARTLLDDADAAAARATLGVLSRASTQAGFRGAFAPGTTDLTPEQTHVLIGGNGHYVFASETGGAIPLPSGWPSPFGQVTGFHVSGNNHTYSWQELTGLSGNRKWMRRATSASGWTSWSEIYHQQSVIGAVAQSGGVPTGALSTGWLSNANGRYRRDADGTQVCQFPFSSSSAEGFTNKTFPIAFADINYSISFISLASSSNTALTLKSTSKATSSVSLAGIIGASGYGAIQFDVTVVGRWY